MDSTSFMTVVAEYCDRTMSKVSFNTIVVVCVPCLRDIDVEGSKHKTDLAVKNGIVKVDRLLHTVQNVSEGITITAKMNRQLPIDSVLAQTMARDVEAVVSKDLRIDDGNTVGKMDLHVWRGIYGTSVAVRMVVECLQP